MSVNWLQPLRPFVQQVAQKVEQMEPQPEYIQECVNDWLTAHPEATTTVQDGAITTAKLANGAVTPDKADFFHHSSNLANPATVTLGYFVNQTNGTLNQADGYAASDWIVVEPDTSYSISTLFGNQSARYAIYDDQKRYITGAYTLNPIFVTPSNAKYLRVSYWNDGINAVPYQWMVAKGTEKPQFEPYDNTYIPSQYILGGNSSEIIFNLPSKIYALVGYELNVYFENLTENWDLYDWDVTCSKGMQLERCYRITPVAADVGTYALTIKASISDGIYVSKTATLVVVAANAGSGLSKSVMILGDSTTANGVAVTKLNDNFSSDVMSITTIGTCGTAPNMMEGRSGWTFKQYFTVASEGSVQNPWYDPDTATFSATHYFATTEVDKPDWFFINLGINDVFGLTNDEAVSNQIEKCKDYCDAMIASMQAESPSTKIGICITIPPNHSQDAFGKAYKCGQTRDRCKRNNALYVQALISEYDERESEGIFLVPIHTNLDTVWNMTIETMPVNARNTGVTYQSPTGNGGVHPSDSGYWQIADVYTAFIKSQAGV